MIVSAGSHQTLSLTAGEVLTVVASAAGAGSVYRLADSVGGQATLAGAISAAATQTFGPFGDTARFDIVVATGYLTYTMASSTPLTQVDETALTGTTATATELNASADLSVNGAVIKTKVIAITSTPTGSEQDTGWDLPAKGVLLDVFIDVTTAEATGGTKTIDVGLLSSESGGDADGFIAALSVSATGVKRGQAGVTTGVLSSNTRGALLADYTAGTNADDRGLYREKPHLLTSVTARSVTYTAKSSDWAEFRGSLVILYVEIA